VQQGGRVVDDLDYWLTQAKLWTVDALYDPDPDGPDNHDGIDRQQLEEACRGDTQFKPRLIAASA
jgi:hypothetical protein